MTKCEEIRNLLRQYPDMTNQELADQTGCEVKFVRDMLGRMAKRGDVEISETKNEDGTKNRSIQVLIEPKTAKMDYKKKIMMEMCEVYVDDFFAAELFTERVEIGKVILRILERM